MIRRFTLLMALLAYTFTISESLQAQSAKEVGQELTEEYFKVLGLDIPNAMTMEGREIWMAALPNNFDLDDFKPEVSRVSDRLGAQVMGEWIKQENVIAYAVNYKGHSYALIHMPANNMVAGAIQEGEVGPAETNTSSNTNNNPSGAWTTIQRFSGSGMTNTEPFTINSSEWRVLYSSEATQSGMAGAGHILQLYLLEPGQELFEGEIVANEVNKQSISGSSFVYKSGRFYFKSNSANGDWEIEVQVKQ